VESAEGAAVRLEVRKEAEVEERIICRAVRGHDEFVRDGGEPVHDALDEGASEKGFEGLVLAHAGGPSASLDANSEHLGYYKVERRFVWLLQSAIYWIL
jgi:hypothetical protein